MRPLVRWLRSLFLGRRLEGEMHEEMRQHVELATERMIARGLSPEDARRAALREFGNVHYLQEEARDARGGRWLEALTPDARLALRMLVRNPLLSVVGGLGMAVAIAIATGFFTFLTFYYSDAPVEQGDRVVTVEYIDGDDSRSTLFEFQLWRSELQSIQDLAAYRRGVRRELESPVSGSGGVEVVQITGSAFRVARVPPLMGRPILETDETEGASPVLLIGYREWRDRFEADPGVVGREVRLDGIPHTVIGVMPEGFRLPVNQGYWTAMATTIPVDGPEGAAAVRVFGRLAPDVGPAAAEAEVAAIGERMAAAYPEIYERFRPAVLPYIRHLFDVQQYPGWAVWLMQLFAGLILLAVAVNVAVLFHARTALRRVEITVRTALGASRTRIVTQLFLEALTLSGLAALTGLSIAWLGWRQLRSVADFSSNLPHWLLGGLPPQTALYVAGLAVLAALVVGVLPALQATGRHLESTLREMSGGTGLRLGRTWTTLICLQVAVAVGVLPAVVGVAWNYTPPPIPHFPVSEILWFGLQPGPQLAGRDADEAGRSRSGSGDADETGARTVTADGSSPSDQSLDYGGLQLELIRRVEDLPEVAGVTFTGSLSVVRIEVEDPTGASVLDPSGITSSRVDVAFFGTLGGTLAGGRDFEPADAVDGATTAIVNRAFVEAYFGGAPAIGRRFREISGEEGGGADRAAGTAGGEDGGRAGAVGEPGAWLEVVGVVENMATPSRGRRPSPQVYRAMPPGRDPLGLLARARGVELAELLPLVRRTAAELAPDRNLIAYPMAVRYAQDPAELRLLLPMVSLITMSVLLLSTAGISAMMSFAVTQRQREVGIRTALGATRGQVIASIFSRSGRQLGAGLMIGIAAAGALDRTTGGALLGGQALSLLLLVGAIMLSAGGLATLGPARRALRIQPMEALRDE